jgi:hypothetical protein
MRFPGCQECNRLWSEYAKATYEHVSAESKLRLAALEQHVAAVERLTLAMEEALYQRESTREAIRRHEATHDRTASRQPADSAYPVLHRASFLLNRI